MSQLSYLRWLDNYNNNIWWSRDSSVGIATDYGLDDRGSNSCGAGNFFPRHRVQTGSGPHPASCPMGIRGSFPGIKRPGRDADHSPPSSAEVKECVELYLHFLNTSSWRSASLSSPEVYKLWISSCNSAHCPLICSTLGLNILPSTFLPILRRLGLCYRMLDAVCSSLHRVIPCTYMCFTCACIFYVISGGEGSDWAVAPRIHDIEIVVIKVTTSRRCMLSWDAAPWILIFDTVLRWVFKIQAAVSLWLGK
jgi:hypothetical protein